MTVRWGIAGPGAIAVGFANDLRLVPGAELAAIGSRNADRAREFAERFEAPNAHGSYEDLAADPSVDVVYVATPQSRHERDVLMFLEAGKHVLCEKPFALNAAQAGRMIEAARARSLFLMEALWSRFLPPYRRLAELLDHGAIGEIQLVEADFGFVLPVDPAHRLFDPERGGGGLLDLGVYPVQLASLVLGAPDRVAAIGRVGVTGVDEQVAAVLGYSRGSLAVVKASITSSMTCTARLSGTKGVIELPAFMHCPGHVTVSAVGRTETIETPWEGGGLQFQAAEVQRCLAAGETESPTVSHAETLSIMRTLDRIRSEIDLTFPGETAT